MKRTSSFTLIACAGLLIVAIGCQKKASDGVAMHGSVLDVGAPAGAYQAQPQVAQQPIVYDLEPSTPTATASAEMGGMMLSGESYTVQKGDTLYGIAKQRYGDGKQWIRIAEANPGLRPETLKAGQTITIP